jgi:hypothetical protein
MPISLNPLVAWGQLRLAFQEGPLARRILRGAMPMALVAALLATVTVAGGFALMLGVDPGSGFGTNWGLFFVVVAAVMAAALLQLALYVAAPAWMASWAHRKYFTKDPMLRSSPISGEARARAVLAASVGVVAVAMLPSALSTPVSNLMTLYTGGNLAPATPVNLAIAGAAGILAAVGSVVTMALFMATGTLRGLTLDSVTGAAWGRGWLAYVAFLGATLGGYIIAVCLGMIVVVPVSITAGMQAATAAAAAPAGTVPQMGTGFFLATMAAQVLTSLAAPLSLAWIYRRFWQRDLPMVLELYREHAPGEA